MTLAARILAGAQVELEGLVGDRQGELEKTSKDSDRYFTSQPTLDLVAATFGGEIDLDPCWDPDERCIVRAKQVMDIRQGQDGLVLPWVGKVFLNPPYSAPTAWLARAAQHAAAGGEVLCLVNAATGSKAWRASVWPFALVCFLSSRPKFASPGKAPSVHPKDMAVCYFGSRRTEFARVWAPHGELGLSVRLMPVRTCPEKHDPQGSEDPKVLTRGS